VADFTLALKLRESAYRVLDWHPMIDGVELVELNPIKPQSLKAVFAGPPQVLRPTIDRPTTRAGAPEPTLARYYQIGRIRMQGLGDQCLTDARTIRVGGIDEIHALVDDPPKQSNCFILVPRWSPHAPAGDAHRAKAEPADGGTATESQGFRDVEV